MVIRKPAVLSIFTAVFTTATAIAIQAGVTHQLHSRQYAQLEATAWTTCLDFPNLECRNVTVPRFYEPVTVVQGNANGTLGTFERRLVSGQPKRHVWLLQGGPMVDSDSLAITIPQFADALETDFVIHLPYQRGSPGTETIPEYPSYPANLKEYLSNQTIPIQAFTTVNIARDIIASIKSEKARDPSVDHYAIGFSYGSQLLNQILLLEPALFKGTIFDGSLPPIGEARSLFRSQSLRLSDMARTIAEDCAQSPECRSLSLNELIAFVDGLSANVSTPCFDQVLQGFGFGRSKDQFFHQVASQLAFSTNLPVPTGIFRNQTVDVEALVPRILNWVKGSKNESDLTEWDNRVLLWAVTNHFAQCTPTSSEAFQKLLVQVYGPLLRYLQELRQAVTPISSFASILTDHILFSEMDSPEWTAANQRSAQEHTLIRSTDALLEYIDTGRAAHAPFLNKFDAPLTAASNIEGDVLVVNGALDPNTPLDTAQSFFFDLEVAEGYDKEFFALDNAGHIVTFGIRSSCSSSLLKAYIGGDDTDKQRFSECFAAENAKSLDWALSDFQAKTGYDLWEGLTKE